MTATLEFVTEGLHYYDFYPVPNGSIHFKVMTTRDAHVLLSMQPRDVAPNVHIEIAAWNNTQIKIGSEHVEAAPEEVGLPSVLNMNKYHGFWVRWDCGVYAVGYNHSKKVQPIINWTNPEPFPVAFTGLASAQGARASWIIEDGPEFQTSRDFNYKFVPVTEGILSFSFRGAKDCHICLTQTPSNEYPMTVIILGGWGNTRSIISYNGQEQVVLSTPDLMTLDRFKDFVIKWKKGKVVVRDVETDEIILEWDNRAFSGEIRHFGIRTAWGTFGKWRINHFKTYKS